MDSQQDYLNELFTRLGKDVPAKLKRWRYHRIHPVALDVNSDDLIALSLYLEAASELESSTFFGEDDKCSLLGEHTVDGLKITGAVFGRTEVFQSALAPFRRIWLNDELSSFGRICGLIVKYGINQERVAFAAQQQTLFNHNIVQPVFQANGITKKVLIDLWLNARFAHGVLAKRRQLQALEAQFTDARVEYELRHAIKAAGYHYLALARESVLPEVTEWIEKFGIELPFKQGATAGGTNEQRIKRSSSQETNEQRFLRILERHSYTVLRGELLKVFSFDGSAPEEAKFTIVRAYRGVIKHKSFSSLIQSQGIAIVPRASHLKKPTSYNTIFDAETRRHGKIQWHKAEAVWVTKAASVFLERLYSQFRNALQNRS